MREIHFSRNSCKDLERVARRGKDRGKLQNVLKILVVEGAPPRQYKPHVLKGNYRGLWECHIEHDWLLIWRHVYRDTIELLRTGSHADLFNK